jgi:WbqC-like protein
MPVTKNVDESTSVPVVANSSACLTAFSAAYDKDHSRVCACEFRRPEITRTSKITNDIVRDDCLWAMNRLGIIQSSYIPWKGYFAIIGLVDNFIIYDDVQYTKGDWRNRNLIKQEGRTRWLTIPVSATGHRTIIRQMEIADRHWAERHWGAIHSSYSRSGYFRSVGPILQRLFEAAAAEKRLYKVNEFFLRAITELLGFKTTISHSCQYELEGDRVGRLISLSRQTGSQVYLTGPRAKAYIDERRFNEAGIKISWMSYSGFPEYRQLSTPPFVHEVTILDLLLNEGIEGARAYMQSFINRCEQTIFESAVDAARRPPASDNIHARFGSDTANFDCDSRL